MTVKQYVLPLLATQVTDLAICPPPFQRAVLNIRYHLDLLNQSVPHLNSLFDRTYSDLDATNRAIVITNLEAGYRDVGERAEIIVRAISELKHVYSK